MTTPEGKVKAQVRKVLDEYKSDIDTYWPVPAGYGPSHLDCILCIQGRFIAIEVKAPGKRPTPRQKKRIADVRRAGGIALVIDGTPNTTTYEELRNLLREIRKCTQCKYHTDTK